MPKTCQYRRATFKMESLQAFLQHCILARGLVKPWLQGTLCGFSDAFCNFGKGWLRPHPYCFFWEQTQATHTCDFIGPVSGLFLEIYGLCCHHRIALHSHAGPPCGTCSRARGIALPRPNGKPGPQPLRDKAHPLEFPWLTGADAHVLKVQTILI